ncbi:MAG TPA: sulfurtransferase [Candidatus Baltobacteraceae bacterium]|jgi:thiosulfate/3-mercaptopyruvate sulfurtransferase|nr:sulfurtransferase [Candidatus Baltobacteraceae bacterium]
MALRTLVDAATLAQHRGDPSWVVIDCRHTLADFGAGRRMYDAGHIPGAFFADVEHDLAGEHTGANGRHPLPDPEAFASFLRSCGVSGGTQIVAYDAGADMFAARLWFLARWIGHDAAAVLDGGVNAWQEAGYELTGAATLSLSVGDLRVRLHPELLVDANYVVAHLDDDAARVVDARGADRFAGQNETIDPVAGHIPGARNRPFKENFNADLRFRTGSELQNRFQSLGPAQTVVHQCGSGVSAAANMLAMEIAGLRGSRLYAGSWSEWISDPSRPVITGEG